jgi:molybdopterin/thiamine biosynthesis adenylyltransferase
MTLKELAHLAQQTLHTRAGCPVRRSHVHELLAAAFGYALEHAPDIEVEALIQHVEHESVLPFLVGCDVIVVCTDNTTSRAYLNQLSQQYMIPLLDLGVQFSVGDSCAGSARPRALAPQLLSAQWSVRGA